MTINEHIEEFGGLPIVEYTRGADLPTSVLPAVRLSLDWDATESGDSFADLFASLLDHPSSGEIRALVIGDWGQAGGGADSSAVVEALVSGRDRLPNLVALFLGEMTVEESEISWILQSDVSPLFAAFPKLEELWIRGGSDLSLGRPQHDRLRKLVIETGGLSRTVVQEIASAALPALEHLELWLGDEGYGNDILVGDLDPLLATGKFPRLRYLGLRDDCDADLTAALIAKLGLPPTVEVLDLSLGTLSDEGAKALAAWPGIRNLKKLDIHHHYVGTEVVKHLRSLLAELDATDAKEPDDWDGEPHRYVAVSE